MVNNERFESNGQADGSPRPSDETLVGRAEAGPVPVKQGEMGYVPPAEPGPTQASHSTDDLPARHPADHSPAPPAPTLPPDAPQDSNASTMTRPSFKKFLRPRRPLPTINGIRSATVLRVVFITLTLAASIIGWAVAVTRLNAWNKNSVFEPPPPPQNINSTESGPLDQMPQSSLVFVHVAFGAAVLFQLFILERSVYRLRAERYAYLHPEEMASTTEVNGVMGLSPWNRPPLPTYAAALGVRGTGDVEDLMIAAPPPPEYGNVRGSTLLLASHFPRPQTDDQRDVLGRPRHDWSRPVSYGEDEMRENLRRSLDLEAALARLEGPTRPENALTRR